MIIVYDVSQVRQHRAGIGRLATMQLKGLLASERRHEFILHGWSPDLDEETITSLVQPNVRLSIAKIPGLVKRAYWNYLRFPSLHALIGPFDVFHGAEPLMPPIGEAKSIISFNDSAYYKFPQFYSKATAKKWDYLYRRSLRKADAVTVLSENTKADLIEMMNLAPEIVHVVRPPTDPIFSELRSSEEKFRLRKKHSLPDQFILFVGTLEPRKNIPNLVRAFERFANEKENPVSLVIVGRRGWLYDEILTTINASKARHKIVMLDYVRDDELATLYQMAMMFVFPSLYEGHGYPVAEAMLSGLPVVTSNNSSLKEIGKDAALLVDPENIEAICDAMTQLYKNEDLRKELSRKGRERATQFSVTNAVKNILQLYDTLEAN